MSCPFSGLTFVVNTKCPAFVRVTTAGAIAYSLYLSSRVFKDVPSKQSGVLMPIRYDIKGEPKSFVHACVGATLYPMLVLGQLSIAAYLSSRHYSAEAPTSACPVNHLDRVAVDTLFAGSLITLLAQHFATRAVTDKKTPEQIAAADATTAGQHMHGHKYGIPSCLFVICLGIAFLPTAIYGISARLAPAPAAQ